MRQRTRKLIGTAFLAVFVPFYGLVAMTVAAVRLPGTSVLTQTIFFAVVGLAWVIPAGAVVYWMQRPPRAPEPPPTVSRLRVGRTDGDRLRRVVRLCFFHRSLHHSLDFKTATRSSRSSFRRTMSALTIAAATVVITA